MINVGCPKPLTLAAGVSLCIAAGLSTAESRRHAAHVHGVAELTVVQEGQVLEIQLTSPAMSIVGFETKAESSAQKEAVEAAKVSLKKADELFTIEGGGCTLSKANIDMSGVVGDGDGHDDDHHGHDDDHHGHDDEDAHHGHGESEQDHEDAHSDIEANYTFSCDDGAAEVLTVGQGKLPFALETINAMWVSDQGQGSTVLSQESRRIKLR